MSGGFWVGIPGGITDAQRAKLERAQVRVEDRPPVNVGDPFDKIYRAWVHVPDAKDEKRAKGWVGGAIDLRPYELFARPAETPKSG